MQPRPATIVSPAFFWAIGVQESRGEDADVTLIL